MWIVPRAQQLRPQTSPRTRLRAMSVPPGHGNRQYVDDAQVREKTATSDALETRHLALAMIARGAFSRRSALETRPARERTRLRASEWRATRESIA